MHKHDLELMAQYADGTLNDDAVARSLVESCPTCRSEYESQTMVLALLAGVTSAEMTDTEKAALHRDLWTDLRAPASAPGRPLAWRGWAVGAAAAVFVVVGLIGVMSQLGGADSTAGETATILDADGGGFARDNSTDEATSIPDALSPAAEESYFYSQSSSFETVAEEARRMRLNDTTTDFTDATTKEQQLCLDRNDLDGFALIEGMEEFTVLLVAIGPSDDVEAAKVAFIDPDSCEIVHLAD